MLSDSQGRVPAAHSASLTPPWRALGAWSQPGEGGILVLHLALLARVGWSWFLLGRLPEVEQLLPQSSLS